MNGDAKYINKHEINYAEYDGYNKSARESVLTSYDLRNGFQTMAGLCQEKNRPSGEEHKSFWSRLSHIVR